MMGVLTLDIVTPLGVAYTANNIEKIVLRRQEAVFEPGSEIAIYARHAPMLVLVPEFDLRFVRDGEKRSVHVWPGSAEVLDDRVTILTSRVEV